MIRADRGPGVCAGALVRYNQPDRRALRPVPAVLGGMRAMGFNRCQAKLQAKDAMRRANPHPMLVTLVYNLAVTLLPLIVMFLVANPFQMFRQLEIRVAYLDAYMSYLPPDAAVAVVLDFLFSTLSAVFLLSIVIGLYTIIMNFGYVSYTLRLARGEQPSYRNLLDGFSTIGRVLLSGILVSIFNGLWSLAGMAGLILILVIAALLLGQLELLGAVVMFAAIIAYAVFIISVAYRYVLTDFFLLDHPDWTALQCVTASKLAMRGHKWEYFVMGLSFIGWSLLVPFTLGILSLWLTPYLCATAANFYDAVTGAPPAGSYGDYQGGYGAGPYQSGGPYQGPGPNQF